MGVPNVQATTPATAPASITPLQPEGHGETLVLNKALAVFERNLKTKQNQKEEEIATCCLLSCSALEAAALQQVRPNQTLAWGCVKDTAMTHPEPPSTWISMLVLIYTVVIWIHSTEKKTFSRK